MKVVAFNGSPRKKGNTMLSIKKVMDVLESEGIETEILQLGGLPMRGCIACYRCVKEQDGRCHAHDDGMNELIQKARDADGIIIGSPTYFAAVSTEVKAFIDRAGLVSRANGNFFERKVGAAVVAVRRAGATDVFKQINMLYFICGMVVPGSSYWNMAFGREPGEAAGDAEGMETMENLGRNMAWLLKKIHA